MRDCRTSSAKPFCRRQTVIVSTGSAGRAGGFGLSRNLSFHFSRPSALLTVKNANSEKWHCHFSDTRSVHLPLAKTCALLYNSPAIGSRDEGKRIRSGRKESRRAGARRRPGRRLHSPMGQAMSLRVRSLTALERLCFFEAWQAGWQRESIVPGRDGGFFFFPTHEQ